MTATASDRDEHLDLGDPTRPLPSGDRGSSRRRQVIAFVAVLALIAAAIVGGRVVLQGNPASPGAAADHQAAPFPTNPAVEDAWGIRFTDVIVLADNGGVELRYEALNDSTSTKIHQGDQTTNELPSIRVDGSSSVVAPSAVLMHFHHGDATAGRTYSIIYGNAGGVVRAGEFVTIVMKDGLTIDHIQVTN